jgi:ferredoxin
MANVIFYFSGTGNSLYAACKIAEVLGDTEVLPVSDNFGADLADYECVGFVYPIYFGGVPLIVKNFVESLEIPKDAYLFAVATSGGSARNGLTEMNALLLSKGHGLNFGALLTMGANYILLYDRRENTDAVNEQAAETLLDIAAAIDRKETRICEKPNPILSVFTNMFRRSVNKTAQKYTVSDDCTACGLCAKICPVKNIEIKDSRPIFTNRCEQCLACIQWCPQKAINYKGKTEQRKRYHHPGVAAKDLMKNNTQRGFE